MENILALFLQTHLTIDLPSIGTDIRAMTLELSHKVVVGGPRDFVDNQSPI